MRCFILAPCYNLMVIIFFPSYFSIIFLAKGKISKSTGLFLRHIGPKQCWPIRLQDFKSNISPDQSNEIVYFFTCWNQKLRVDKKILGWVWSEMVVATLVTRWMDEIMDELSWFFACWCKFRKVKNYFNNFWAVVAKNVHGTLISELLDESSWFLHANNI